MADNSKENTFKVLNRDQRASCWAARDELYKCLDTNGNETNNSQCSELVKTLYSACPSSWAEHFVQKRKHEINKAQELKRLGAHDLKEALKIGDVVIKS